MPHLQTWKLRLHRLACGLHPRIPKRWHLTTKSRNSRPSLCTNVVYHLPQIFGNSRWDVNGKCVFDSSHWKIPGTNGNSEREVPTSRLGRSEWKFVYHLQVS